MIRVLQVGLSQNCGGIESVVVNYYQHMDKCICQFDFVDIYGAGLAHAQKIQALGGKIFQLPNYKKHLLRCWLKKQ